MVLLPHMCFQHPMQNCLKKPCSHSGGIRQQPGNDFFPWVVYLVLKRYEKLLKGRSTHTHNINQPPSASFPLTKAKHKLWSGKGKKEEEHHTKELAGHICVCTVPHWFTCTTCTTKLPLLHTLLLRKAYFETCNEIVKSLVFQLCYLLQCFDFIFHSHFWAFIAVDIF